MNREEHREARGLMVGVAIGAAMWLAAAAIGIYLSMGGA